MTNLDLHMLPRNILKEILGLSEERQAGIKATETFMMGHRRHSSMGVTVSMSRENHLVTGAETITWKEMVHNSMFLVQDVSQNMGLYRCVKSSNGDGMR